jgi:hypothetical protein
LRGIRAEIFFVYGAALVVPIFNLQSPGLVHLCPPERP